MNIALLAVANSTDASALGAAVSWIAGTLLGSVAVGLCIVAVAVVGFMTLEGRILVRQGARVILGCFILLGAPAITAGFLRFWDSEPAPLNSRSPIEQSQMPREEPPAAKYDPYAGASLRRD